MGGAAKGLLDFYAVNKKRTAMFCILIALLSESQLLFRQVKIAGTLLIIVNPQFYSEFRTRILPQFVSD